MGSLEEFYNLTLTMPNINKTLTNQSIYISMRLPINEEVYIADFQSIPNRQKIHSVATYLCPKPYSKENFWFGKEPCYHMDIAMKIYEWYHNIPAVQWPTDAGFQIGLNTPYRYVVIHIRYFQFDINDKYSQQINIIRKRPKHLIESYHIVANSRQFSCRYHSPLINIFSTQFYSNYEGRSVSLYRIRNNELKLITKGNLHWPQTFYQLETSVDIQTNDYLIGTCVHDDKPLIETDYKNHDIICQISLLYWVNEEDGIQREFCWNNDYRKIVEQFLPNDADIPPETLYDINPTYPKLTPDEWAIMTLNHSLRSIDNDTNTLSLTYSKDDRAQEVLLLAHRHGLKVVLFIWGLSMLIGFVILFFIIIMRSRKYKKYHMRNANRTKSMIIGGEASSLSKWLTKRRFQQNDQDDIDRGEYKPLSRQHRWTSETEESDLTDNEVFNKTDFHTISLRN